jgi:hypothetical protein
VPEDEAVCSTESSVFNGLHGVTSQKTELLITATVRNSNPTLNFSSEVSGSNLAGLLNILNQNLRSFPDSLQANFLPWIFPIFI